MMKRMMLALGLSLAVPVLAGDADKGMMDKPMDKKGAAMEQPVDKDRGMDKGMAMEPALGGHCPVALAKMGVLKPGDAMHSTKVGDRTYQCSSAEAHAAFQKNPRVLARKAEKAYLKLMKKKKAMDMKKM